MVPLFTAAAVQSNVRPVFPDASRTLTLAHRDENLQRAIELVDKLATWNPSRLYVFPEFFLTGAGGAGDFATMRQLCVTIPGPEIDQLCALARRVNAYIAGMAWEYMEEWPDRYWNTGFICSPEGEVVLKYHKHYDPTGKTKPGDVFDAYVERYGIGQLFPVVDTPIGRLGMLICYDINYPEMARSLALQGAEILLHPTSEGRAPFLLEDVGGWEIGKRSRAYENLCYVVSANQGSFLNSWFPSERMRGRSQIIDFTGQVLCIAETTGEAIVQADIELERLRQKRQQFQMNFLAQLQPHIHAPFYAQRELWPRHLWEDTPPAGDRANIMAGRQAIERLTAEGLFVAPDAAIAPKQSFV